MRFVRLSAIAAIAVLVFSNFSSALMVAFSPPYQRALNSEMVVVGKVTSIDKDAVEVQEGKGGPKVTYRVALVKVEKGLKGAEGLTHIKIGFVPPAPIAAPVNPNGGLRPILPNRRRSGGVEVKEGQEAAFFLTKHPTGNFYVINFSNPPVDITTDHGKQELESVTKTLAIVANPKAALTASKAEDRYVAACTMLIKHRQPPLGAVKLEQKPISAEENALILKGLLEGDWDRADENRPMGTMAIGLLGLGPKDGFKYPQIKPGQKPGTVYKSALETWLKGPGKDFVIKSYVASNK